MKPSPAEIDAFCGACELRDSNGTCTLNKHQVTDNATSGLLTLAMLPLIAAEHPRKVPDALLEIDARLGDFTTQERYVARKWCGWARVDGKDGEMTENGFCTFRKE